MDTLRIIQRRFIKGLSEAPHEFVAPLIVVVRWLWCVPRFVSFRLQEAKEKSRIKAIRREHK